MITDRVWEEMNKAKGYLIQIQLYTDRLRKRNRRISVAIILASIVCAATIPFNPTKWVAFILAVLVALASIVKEFLPQILQPESELAELDKIHDFYKEYLQKLENIFVQRFDEKSKMDDEMLIARFNSIKKTEGCNESNLNRLCRGLKDKEKELIQKNTVEYFERNFKS